MKLPSFTDVFLGRDKEKNNDRVYRYLGRSKRYKESVHKRSLPIRASKNQLDSENIGQNFYSVF